MIEVALVQRVQCTGIVNERQGLRHRGPFDATSLQPS